MPNSPDINTRKPGDFIVGIQKTGRRTYILLAIAVLCAPSLLELRPPAALPAPSRTNQGQYSSERKLEWLVTLTVTREESQPMRWAITRWPACRLASTGLV